MPPSPSPKVRPRLGAEAAAWCALLALDGSPPDAESAAKAARLLAAAEQVAASDSPFFGLGPLERHAAAIARFPPNVKPSVEVPVRGACAEQLLQFGRYEEALVQLERVLELCRKHGVTKTAASTARRMGIAWMRIGEKANCLAMHGPESCLFPLAGGGIHVDRAGSARAQACFRDALALDPRDDGAAWLLNVAAMTLGTWPDSVPEPWRVPAERVRSEQELTRHPNAAPARGLDHENLAGGAIVDDFDGDGRLDVVTSAMAPRAPLRFWRQREAGQFTESAASAGLDLQLGGLHCVHFDANGDGRLDLYVPRGAWMGASGAIPHSLLLQQGDGRFVDRTGSAGVEVAAPSQAAASADIDHDGDIDLFVGCEDDGSGKWPSRLFRNRGDGTFTECAAAAGIADCGFVKGAVFGDYDRDGRPDLYVSSMRGPNKLFRNVDGQSFEEVAARLGVGGPHDTFGCAWFDYDQDGWLDLWVAAYPLVDRTAAMGAWMLRGERTCDTQRLWRNDGKGGFVDVTAQVGLDRVCFPMGCNFGDLDGDGFPDLYLATGEPDYGALYPNVLLRNDGGRRFLDVSAATGTGHLQKGHAVSFADVDADGDQDLFVELGGAWPDDFARNTLFENPGHGNRWLTLRLRGTRSNRFGVGARVRVRIAEHGGERTVHADAGGNASFGGNSLQVELGLGQATRIVALEVHWPASGTTQTFGDVPLDAAVTVTEGAPDLQR